MARSRSRSTVERGAAVVCCAGLLLALGAPLAPGVARADDDSRKVALDLLAAAKFYYKKGDFKSAAARFLEAYRIDPRPEYLFNAARSEQRGMQLDKARKHFEELLKLAGLGAQVKSRATMHLQEIKAIQAAIAAARNKGAVQTARKLEDQAREQSGKTGGKDELQGMAGVEEKGPDKPVVKPAPVKAGPVEPAAVARPGPEAASKPVRPPAAGTPWLGYGVSGLGVIGLGAGAFMLLQSSADQDALDAKTNKRDDKDGIVGIDLETYETEQTRINDSRRVGAIVAGVGLAAAGAGVYLLLRDDEPDKTAWIAPAIGGRGFVFGARF